MSWEIPEPPSYLPLVGALVACYALVGYLLGIGRLGTALVESQTNLLTAIVPGVTFPDWVGAALIAVIVAMFLTMWWIEKVAEPVEPWMLPPDAFGLFAEPDDEEESDQ